MVTTVEVYDSQTTIESTETPVLVEVSNFVMPAIEIDDLSDVTITNPIADQVLTYDGSGWINADPPSGGAGGAPTTASYVVIGNNATLTAERVLTGTSNKITITDNGANGTVVLNVGSDIVTLTDTQALSNKTLTSPKMQVVVMNSDAQGVKIYANDGTTLLFHLDSSGNVGINGILYQL